MTDDGATHDDAPGDDATGTTSTGEPAPTAPTRARRGRRAATATLAVLAVIGLLASTLALWSHRLLLNTDAWVDTVGGLADDPEVTDAVAQRLTEQVMATIDAEQLAEDALPEEAQFLAAPLTTAVEGFVEDAVAAVLASDQFATLWREANRVAHEEAVQLLRGGDGPVRVDDGVVTLDFLPLVGRVLERIQEAAPGLLGDADLPDITFDTPTDQAVAELSDALGRDLPEGFGTVDLFSSDQLGAVQDGVALFDTIVWVLPVLTLLLLAGAFWLSGDRRGLAVRLGLATVAVMLLATGIVRTLRAEILGLIGDQEARTAAATTIATLLSELRFLANFLLVAGAVAAVAAYLTGDGRGAVAVRTQVRRLTDRTGAAVARSGVASDPMPWVRDNLAGLQLAGVVLAVGWAFLGSPTWRSLLLVALLLAAYEGAVWFLAARPGVGGDEGVPPGAAPADA